MTRTFVFGRNGGSGGSRRSCSQRLVVASGAMLWPLSGTLAKELAPRRVNLVSPGLTQTEAYAQMPDAQRMQMFADAATRLPAGKTGESHEIAQAVLLCVTNRFVTGSVFDVDGGARLT
jgi:NAD(P)-dependent dehydrogenase (short-subunit alcohol dehydrogenase family)